VSGEHLLAVAFWRHATQRGYEKDNLDQLAKLFRSRVPRSRQIGQMLADVFDLCKLELQMDDQAARAQDAEARRLGKLRNSKGRMSRADAVEEVARLHRLEVGKLTNWMDGKTGARQRHRTAQKKRPPA
jgi:hypothetical protein